MSIIAKFIEAVEKRDKEVLTVLIHDDYKFIPHVNNQVFTKSDMITVCMSGTFTRNNGRILYENDDIGVDHAFVSFANNSTPEAVLSVHMIQQGKIISTETGATPLTEDYTVVSAD